MKIPTLLIFRVIYTSFTWGLPSANTPVMAWLWAFMNLWIFCRNLIKSCWNNISIFDVWIDTITVIDWFEINFWNMIFRTSNKFPILQQFELEKIEFHDSLKRVRSGDRPVRIGSRSSIISGPKFSNFSWPWSGLVKQIYVSALVRGQHPRFLIFSATNRFRYLNPY